MKYPLGRRIGDAVTMFTVLFVSLMLLVYVAFGEAKLTYEHYQGDKLAGQVKVVQNAMQTPLRSGLTLRQFVGFKTLTDPIFSSDPTIESLIVYDPDGSPVFTAGDPSIVAKLPAPINRSDKREVPPVPNQQSELLVEAEPTKTGDTDYELERVAGQYRIVVPLRNKFETVGSLAITMSEAVVSDSVRKAFEPLLIVIVGPSLFFALIIAIFGPAMARSKVPWAQITFATVFLAASIGVIATLISLYSDGAQAKARALADSLGQRLHDVVAFNINIDEIDGLDKVFGEYVQLNPDISAATLTVDQRIVIHSDKSRIGQVWAASESNYQYVVDLTPSGGGRIVEVAVELPSDIVLGRIIRSVKNFAALFIASGFLASLFFHLGGAVRRPLLNSSKEGNLTSSSQAEARDWMLKKVMPVFFLGVMLEHLTYAFLPQFVQGAVQNAGVADSLASMPFVGFYLLFAVTLIPAGYLAQRIGPKPMMICGLLFAGAGFAVLTTYPDFWFIMAARCLSGVGQGMLFIGVQSYLLAVASSGKKTQAAGMIVYGFQGGMISGMAVGSLLVQYMGTSGVFLLASAIGFVASLYAAIAVPKISLDAATKTSSASTQNLTRSIAKALSNYSFMNTMVTIGVPAKAVLTGVMIFALPLLLTKSGYAQEDIGQIIMIYAISVVVSSWLISSHVDNFGNQRNILFSGALLSGFGLAVISLMGSIDATTVSSITATIIVMSGVILVGIAHGFINAPVVTYVADSPLAAQIGTSTATATYRFLERIGHIAGPVLVGQLLIWANFDWSAIGLVGAVIALLGLIFILTSASDEPHQGNVDAFAQDEIMQRIQPKQAAT